MNPLRHLVRLLLILCLSLCFVPTRAQKPETLAQFGKGPHLGSVEEAVVGIEVTFKAEGGEPLTRTGNGFLLRCDGFVLAPSSLFVRPSELAKKDYTGSVRVTLHPGTEQEQRVSTTLPRKMANNVRYTVLKLPDVHIPAVQSLLPDGLETGQDLDVVWSAYDASAKRFLAPQKQSLPLGKREAETAQTSGTRVLTQALNGVPAGAVVVGSERLAVGIVTHGPSARFATLDSLDLVTNCVTPLPTTEAEFGKKREMLAQLAERSPNEEEIFLQNEEEEEKVPEPSPGMVKVPGGPVRLTPALLSVQKDMGKATIACVAPFLIDRYEVTNGQYLAFWKAMAEKRKADFRRGRDWFPLGWADQEPYFPEGLADVPVLGVSYEGAKAYANWVGKRLPTPYEWSLAAFGPSGGNEMPDWAKQYVADRQRTWKEIVEAHLHYLNNNPPLLKQYTVALNKLARGKEGDQYGEWVTAMSEGKKVQIPLYFSEPVNRELYLPWYFYREDHIAAVAWSKNTILKAMAPLFETYKRPQYVLPTGSRKFDASPYGARDMALNAYELVCPPAELRDGEFPAHYMRVRWRFPEAWIQPDHAMPLKQGVTPFFPWYSSSHMYHPLHGEDYLLSRRLRSMTSNAEQGNTIWPNQQPRAVAAANLYEISSMMSPLVGWDVAFLSGQTVIPGAPTVTGPLADFWGMGEYHTPSPTSRRPQENGGYLIEARQGFERRYYPNYPGMLWYEAASYSWWKDMPTYYVQEMGRPYDVDAPEGRNLPSQPGQRIRSRIRETYLVPGGFRCVR